MQVLARTTAWPHPIANAYYTLNCHTHCWHPSFLWNPTLHSLVYLWLLNGNSLYYLFKQYGTNKITIILMKYLLIHIFKWWFHHSVLVSIINDRNTVIIEVWFFIGNYWLIWPEYWANIPWVASAWAIHCQTSIQCIRCDFYFTSTQKTSVTW